jgi:hypothetical protein
MWLMKVRVANDYRVLLAFLVFCCDAVVMMQKYPQTELRKCGNARRIVSTFPVSHDNQKLLKRMMQRIYTPDFMFNYR